MPRKKLSEAEIEAAVQNLHGWKVKKGKLTKEYQFDTFAQAIGWMVSVAIHADKLDHHPDWSNAYNRVEVSLVTHDMDDSISNLDVELAHKMEELFSQG
jgi:4a-hydroxytetrahydrobiopterin dehydratase